MSPATRFVNPIPPASMLHAADISLPVSSPFARTLPISLARCADATSKDIDQDEREGRGHRQSPAGDLAACGFRVGSSRVAIRSNSNRTTSCTRLALRCATSISRRARSSRWSRPLDACAGLEVALVGNEGMVGSALLLGVAVSPLNHLVQGAGGALRIDTASFKRELLRCKPTPIEAEPLRLREDASVCADGSMHAFSHGRSAARALAADDA